METRLNSLIYPIYGFIRSEFDAVDQMLVKEERWGQQANIGKSEWKVGIKNECSEWIDNMDYLGVYLKRCSGIGLYSSITVHHNFQLISWDEEGKNHVWTGSSLYRYGHFYNNKSTSRGTSKFLKWEELLNGGYVKDGKIVVECAFRIDSEDGIARRSIDFTEERPNTKDIEMICGVEDVMKSKRIEEIIDVSKIEKGVFTETYFINGIPFKFKLSRWDDWEDIDLLSVFLYLNSDDQSEWWRCEADVDISILNQNGESKFKTNNSNWLFQNSSNNIELDEYIKWNELMDPENGYVKDGKIVFQAFVQIVTQFGFDEKTRQGYSQPMRKMTDACLKVGDKRLHVSRKILSKHSSYFSKLFSRESEEYEVEVLSRDEESDQCYPVHFEADYETDYFIQFLEFIHNEDTIKSQTRQKRDPVFFWRFETNRNKIENVLELAKKWGAPEVIERCDAVLKRMELTDTMKMLELVNKYNLSELRRRFILKLKDEEILKSVVNNPRYKTLNDSLKVAILEWRLVPEELQTEEKEETDYQFNTDFKLESEFSDVEITVEGYKYHASKQILANASVFFMKRFYGPLSSDESQIKILKVSPLQFETLLTHIYHPTRPVTCASLDSLLSLSKQFSVQRLMDKCEEYLILNNTLSLIRKLEYAGKYELPFLLSACLKQTDEEPLDDQIGVLPAYVNDAVAKRNIVRKRLKTMREENNLRKKNNFFSSISSLFVT